MADQHEIRFAKDRQTLQQKMEEVARSAIHLLDLDVRAFSAHLESPTGPLLGHTIAGQLIVKSWGFETASGAKKVEAGIGHTGAEWNPVLTITDDFEKCDVFVLKEKDWPEYELFRQSLLESFKKIKGA